MSPYRARALFFVFVAGVVWVIYSAAATPPERTMAGIWETQSNDREASLRDRAEALYRLGMHHERKGEYDDAMEAYGRLLDEIPYVNEETSAISWGFRHDEARWAYRALLTRASSGEIHLERSWPSR